MTSGSASATSGTTRTEHDPLCPVVKGCVCGEPDDYLCCQCDLIREVRAEEQARQRQEMSDLLLEARSHP